MFCRPPNKQTRFRKKKIRASHARWRTGDVVAKKIEILIYKIGLTSLIFILRKKSSLDIFKQ
jgi:hypothetical protein